MSDADLNPGFDWASANVREHLTSADLRKDGLDRETAMQRVRAFLARSLDESAKTLVGDRPPAVKFMQDHYAPWGSPLSGQAVPCPDEKPSEAEIRDCARWVVGAWTADPAVACPPGQTEEVVGAMCWDSSLDVTGRVFVGSTFVRCAIHREVDDRTRLTSCCFDQCTFTGPGWPDGWGITHAMPNGLPEPATLSSAPSTAEPDAEYRARVLRVVGEADRAAALVATGAALDAIGRRCDRFRYGAPLEPAAPAKAEKSARWEWVTSFAPPSDPGREIILEGVPAGQLLIEKPSKDDGLFKLRFIGEKA